jgi:fucose 4-O-acetylase-like acetyltransferase
VLFHAGSPGAFIAYAALPFFLMLIVSLGFKSAMSADFPKYISGRADRLLKPWLVWSAVYGALKLAEAAVSNATLKDEFALYMLLTGPAIHLWFLPFAFTVCLFLWPLARVAALPIGVGAFILTLALQWYSQIQDLPVPVAQWAYVAPAVCLGLCLAVISRKIAVLCAFSGLSLVLGWTEGLLQISFAAFSLLACQWITAPQTPLSKKIAAASMGVYLVHPLVFSLLQRTFLLEKSKFSTAILVSLVSLYIALALMRMKKEISLK